MKRCTPCGDTECITPSRFSPRQVYNRLNITLIMQLISVTLTKTLSFTFSLPKNISRGHLSLWQKSRFTLSAHNFLWTAFSSLKLIQNKQMGEKMCRWPLLDCCGLTTSRWPYMVSVNIFIFNLTHAAVDWNLYLPKVGRQPLSGKLYNRC